MQLTVPFCCWRGNYLHDTFEAITHGYTVYEAGGTAAATGIKTQKLLMFKPVVVISASANLGGRKLAPRSRNPLLQCLSTDRGILKFSLMLGGCQSLDKCRIGAEVMGSQLYSEKQLCKM